MGYWIYTPEQGERIRAGDKTARDQFFTDNKPQLVGFIKSKVKRLSRFGYSINDAFSTLYMNLPKVIFRDEKSITHSFDVFLFQLGYYPEELRYKRTFGNDYINVLPLYEENDDGDLFCVADLYTHEEVDLSSPLTADSIALFWEPFFKKKKDVDLLYTLCLGNNHTVACDLLHISRGGSHLARVKRTVCQHYDEFCEFLRFSNSPSYDIALSYKPCVVGLLQSLEDERLADNARHYAAAKRRREKQVS